MALERTFSILKPDTVEKHKIGEVTAMIEAAGLRIVAAKMIHLSKRVAEGFYAEHRERKFFGELVEFMTRGPVLAMVLEGEGAVAKYREVMGATDPAKAAAGTIRKKFGDNVGENAIHGSDATETAKREIAYFFPGCELI
ncbi:MAG: nucleoside-diphosphate kinase [Polyangiales bacterium]